MGIEINTEQKQEKINLGNNGETKRFVFKESEEDDQVDNNSKIGSMSEVEVLNPNKYSPR